MDGTSIIGFVGRALDPPHQSHHFPTPPALPRDLRVDDPLRQEQHELENAVKNLACQQIGAIRVAFMDLQLAVSELRTCRNYRPDRTTTSAEQL